MVSRSRNLDIAEAGQLVTRKLLEIYEREGGEVTPWSLRWLREQVLRLSMELDRESIEEAKNAMGRGPAAEFGGPKPTASLFLVGVAEALETYFEPVDEGQ